MRSGFANYRPAYVVVDVNQNTVAQGFLDQAGALPAGTSTTVPGIFAQTGPSGQIYVTVGWGAGSQISGCSAGSCVREYQTAPPAIPTQSNVIFSASTLVNLGGTNGARPLNCHPTEEHWHLACTVLIHNGSNSGNATKPLDISTP